MIQNNVVNWSELFCLNPVYVVFGLIWNCFVWLGLGFGLLVFASLGDFVLRIALYCFITMNQVMLLWILFTYICTGLREPICEQRNCADLCLFIVDWVVDCPARE